jgi:hypothetical protein
LKRAACLQIILIAACLCSCITNHKQPYPVEWPSPSTATSDCSKISGKYADAVSRYPGGLPDGVWAFSTPVPREKWKSVVLTSLNQREISIFFDTHKTLHIEYLLDGEVAMSHELTSSEYTCENGIVKFVISQRMGKHIYDMFPDFGKAVDTRELCRIDDYLYVKNSGSAKALVFYFWPQMSFYENWARFRVRETPIDAPVE